MNFIFALLLLTSYMVPHVDPGKFWWPSLLGLFYPYLLIANIVFAVFWLLTSWKFWFISLLCVLAGYNLHRNLYKIVGQDGDFDSSVKVLTYNVNHFYTYLANKSDSNNILSFIADQQADIICLQETKLQIKGELNPLQLKKRFSGINHLQLAHQSTWNGPVTFTRFPIVNMGELRFDGSNNMVIFTDMLIASDTVRVYNCHLQSYGIRPEDYSMMDSLSIDNVKIDEVKNLGRKLRDGYKMRSVQVGILKKHISECPYRLIVCGDFNDTPNSFTYKQIGGDLFDAFVVSGKGLSNTYRGKLPSYRIDYVMYSEGFDAYNYKRHKLEYSDHFPITVDLILAKPD